MEGERKPVRKLEEDPTRCFKCQQIGVGPKHTTHNCTSLTDICAKCAGAHPTAGCKIPKAKWRCASCLKVKLPHNHAAWDRCCLCFLKEKAKLRDRKPEYKYKYFPEKDLPWMWAMRNDLDEFGEDERWKGGSGEKRYATQQNRLTSRDQGYSMPLGNGPQFGKTPRMPHHNNPKNFARRSLNEVEKSKPQPEPSREGMDSSQVTEEQRREDDNSRGWQGTRRGDGSRSVSRRSRATSDNAWTDALPRSPPNDNHHQSPQCSTPH